MTYYLNSLSKHVISNHEGMDKYPPLYHNDLNHSFFVVMLYISISLYFMKNINNK